MEISQSFCGLLRIYELYADVSWHIWRYSKVAWLNCSGLLVTQGLISYFCLWRSGRQQVFSKFDVSKVHILWKGHKNLKKMSSIWFDTWTLFSAFKRLLALFFRIFKVTICSCHSHNRMMWSYNWVIMNYLKLDLHIVILDPKDIIWKKKRHCTVCTM